MSKYGYGGKNDDIVEYIRRLEDRIASLERTPRAIATSIDEGTFRVGPENGNNILLSGGGLTVNRTDSDNNLFQSMSMGGASDDQFMLYDSRGNALAGFDSGGSATMNNASVNGVLYVGGRTIDEMIGSPAVGLVARQAWNDTAAFNDYEFGSDELGITEILFDSYPNRMYKICYSGMFNAVTTGAYIFRLRFVSSSGYDGVPNSPVVSSPQGAQKTYNVASVGWQPLDAVMFLGNYAGQYRVLLTAQAIGSAHGKVGAGATWPSHMWVEDMGAYTRSSDGQINEGEGKRYQAPTASAPVTTTPVKTYKSTWKASSSRSWRDGVITPGDLQQGYYPPAKRFSMATWMNANSTGSETNKNLINALKGASISRMEVYLKNLSWYYGSGGQALIGHHDMDYLPDTPQTSGGGAFSSGNWTTGAGRWITLPPSWYDNFASGDYRGITLGEGAGTSMTYYGHFSNLASDLQLRVTYSK